MIFNLLRKTRQLFFPLSVAVCFFCYGCSLSDLERQEFPALVDVQLSGSDVTRPFLFIERLGHGDFEMHFLYDDIVTNSYDNTEFIQTGNWGFDGSSSEIVYTNKKFGDIVISGHIKYSPKFGFPTTTEIDTWNVEADFSFHNYFVGKNIEYRNISYSLNGQKYTKPVVYSDIDISVNGVRYHMDDVAQD